MAFKSFRKESRVDYGRTDGANLTRDQLKTGALLRIADATEKMCLDREKLERDYNYMRNDRDYWRRRAEHAERRAASLKGWITRMKKAKS